jgi:hypothetical protein
MLGQPVPLQIKMWLIPLFGLAKCPAVPFSSAGVVPREPNGDIFEMDDKSWCGWILDTEAKGAQRELENFEVDPSGKMVFGCGVCPPYP